MIGQARVDPGLLIAREEYLAIFFFNEINRARPQVHSLLLRVMAERSVSAFNREHRFPNLLVFADRNRVAREETFEISSATRDRFMMEVTVDAPATDADRRELMFNPRFHDADRLVSELDGAMVAYQELNQIAELLQLHVQASAALQSYALALWRATAMPTDFGVRLSDLDTAHLMLAGASPRGMSVAARRPRLVMARRSRVRHTRGCAGGLRRDHCAPAVLPAGLRDAPS